jgi:hypothetical protein
MENNQVTVHIPVALRQLITTSNELLKNYQAKLLGEIEEANVQMMEILKLDPRHGWRLDMERMVYTRPQTEEEAGQVEATVKETTRKATKE